MVPILVGDGLICATRSANRTAKECQQGQGHTKRTCNEIVLEFCRHRACICGHDNLRQSTVRRQWPIRTLLSRLSPTPAQAAHPPRTTEATPRKGAPSSTDPPSSTGPPRHKATQTSTTRRGKGTISKRRPCARLAALTQGRLVDGLPQQQMDGGSAGKRIQGHG
jgi:hypothetical protein